MPIEDEFYDIGLALVIVQEPELDELLPPATHLQYHQACACLCSACCCGFIGGLPAYAVLGRGGLVDMEGGACYLGGCIICVMPSFGPWNHIKSIVNPAGGASAGLSPVTSHVCFNISCIAGLLCKLYFGLSGASCSWKTQSAEFSRDADPDCEVEYSLRLVLPVLLWLQLHSDSESGCL